MKFIKQDGSNPGKLRVILYHANQDTLGYDLDPGILGNLAIKAHAIPHTLANRLAQQLRHPARTGACGQTARLQHDDLLIPAPGAFQQRQRHLGRLARPRWGLQHHIGPAFKCGNHIRQNGIDGQGGEKCQTFVTFGLQILMPVISQFKAFGKPCRR